MPLDQSFCGALQPWGTPHCNRDTTHNTLKSRFLPPRAALSAGEVLLPFPSLDSSYPLVIALELNIHLILTSSPSEPGQRDVVVNAEPVAGCGKRTTTRSTLTSSHRDVSLITLRDPNPDRAGPAASERGNLSSPEGPLKGHTQFAASWNNNNIVLHTFPKIKSKAVSSASPQTPAQVKTFRKGLLNPFNSGSTLMYSLTTQFTRSISEPFLPSFKLKPTKFLAVQNFRRYRPT
ncbi:uncharacterized protein LOC128804499 [Vidua macroura]|uniref:uncharacterized protein LOC128804499 n=1 Tax=Vidua macroura TaxID=187451 RepID=UPI0023A838A1|nr:uncharacterized protein LOC128804499 [Vidua macroura]